MLFNSVSFAIFLIVLFALYWIMPSKYRWGVLLVSSYYFYSCWNIKYVFILLFTTAVSYFAGRLIYKADEDKKKKLIIVLSVCIEVLVLGFFKYFNFLSQTVADIFGALSIPVHQTTLKLMVPVGLSFYTFQTIGYIADVYNRKIEPEKNFGVYALFVSFFPHIMSGPIARADKLIPQLKADRVFDNKLAEDGLKLMAWGFFKKLCIADVLTTYVDLVYLDVKSYAGFDLLLVIFFYTIQIYCDFSGYTDIAIGVGKLFGIELMTNFKAPYLSTSIKEFWSRWHISLTSWLRDYVYIPLGGNRCSTVKNYRNLMATFLISGLWHGANWTFVLWGALHGLLQIAEKIFAAPIKRFKSYKLGRAISWFVVFVLCSIAWVFFRADSVSDAVYVIAHSLQGVTSPGQYLVNNIGLGGSKYVTIAFSLAVLTAFDLIDDKKGMFESLSKKPTLIRHAVYILLLVMIMFLKASGEAAFVYFKF